VSWRIGCHKVLNKITADDKDELLNLTARHAVTPDDEASRSYRCGWFRTAELSAVQCSRHAQATVRPRIHQEYDIEPSCR
jgi:hypothetical protein